MELHNLKPFKGSTKNTKRIGRGEGSGHGGTSTRGHKGAKSRSGYKSKLGFEGGQMPLQRRVPKFGFRNFNRVEYHGINLDTLQEMVDREKVTEKITVEDFVKNGIVNKKERVKVLGRGELKTKLSVESHAFSKSAQAAIEAAGGEAKIV